MQALIKKTQLNCYLIVKNSSNFENAVEVHISHNNIQLLRNNAKGVTKKEEIPKMPKTKKLWIAKQFQLTLNQLSRQYAYFHSLKEYDFFFCL